MTLTLQDLKSHLWNCVEILRGSAVDRTDWKAYLLPLLFFKRICDVWDEEAAEAVAAFKAALLETRAAEDRLREVRTTGGWLK
jgi:type I restriction-modification system DNA methylase subunit